MNQMKCKIKNKSNIINSQEKVHRKKEKSLIAKIKMKILRKLLIKLDNKELIKIIN